MPPQAGATPRNPASAMPGNPAGAVQRNPANAPAQPSDAPLKSSDAAAGSATGQALALAPQPPEAGIKLTATVARLPVELDVTVPAKDFRVRQLLALEPGQVIETQWAQGADLPLAAGSVQLAWSEFEVIDTQLAVRLTRLA